MKAPTRVRLIASGPHGKRKIEELRAMAETHHKGAIEQLAKGEAARKRVENVRDEVEALRRLYGDRGDVRDVEAASLAAALPDLGECIATQLVELSRDPCRDRCDRVVANLRGVILHIQRLHAAQEGK